ncbi:hypothetical protein FB451DRAFT_1220248 [Mycena latifolia]|nr:hypothetical protein FB451DRAFT_1220248 [Mycena latifolia]
MYLSAFIFFRGIGAACSISAQHDTEKTTDSTISSTPPFYSKRGNCSLLHCCQTAATSQAWPERPASRIDSSQRMHYF